MASDPDINSRGFWARHGQLLAALVAIASALVAIGPNSWMEWLLWGTTVVSHPTARIILVILAVAFAAVVILPWLQGRRRQS